MSAHIVNLDLVDVLARAATSTVPGEHTGMLGWYWPDPSGEYGCGYSRTTFDGQTAVGQMLLRENERSIMARYPDTMDDDGAPILNRMPGPLDYAGWEAYEFPRQAFTMPEVVCILSMIATYEYQSCEHPGWRDSEAYGFCRALTSHLHRMLPGYADADQNYRHRAGVRMVNA